MSITDSQVRLSALNHTVRSPAVAGMFYPEHSEKLREDLRKLLSMSKSDSMVPKAIISPHAGYVYSGMVAANGFSSLRAARDSIKEVILLGPAHRVRVDGIAIPSVAAFQTPLGEIKLAQSALKRIESLPQVKVMDAAHRQEHSLEVQLPFLQEVLSDFRLTPMVVGNASAKEVAEVLDILWGGKETLIIISSDLSHYHEYDESRRRDEHTAEMIENFNYEQLTPHHACGAHPLSGLLLSARARKMDISRQFLCNSGDTAGSKDRVVGYGCWCLYESDQPFSEHKNRLMNIARESIQHGLEHGSAKKLDSAGLPSVLMTKTACFVTLKKQGKLRGCIGSLQPSLALADAVAELSFKAAFRDPRFSPLEAEEYPDIDISISVLSPQEALVFSDDAELLALLRPGIDGLTIQSAQHSATFLPSVWEQIPDKFTFLAQLKAKAGIPPDTNVAKAWRYSADYLE